MSDIRITIGASGEVEFIHSDALASLFAGEGSLQIERASHVEFDNVKRAWYADLSPSNGPLLEGYATREAALEAEVAWLTANKFHC